MVTQDRQLEYFSRRSPPKRLGRIRDLAWADSGICAIKEEDETVRCWPWEEDKDFDPFGMPEPRQWEDGNGVVVRTENWVPPDLGPVLAIATDGTEFCAISHDQTARCWDGETYHPVPRNPGKIRALAMGRLNACAIKEDEMVSCWEGPYPHPVPTDLGKVKAISASRYPFGQSYVCAIKEDRTVQCWGWNINQNELSEIDRTLQPPENLRNVIAISAGPKHACALRQDQTVQCWGDNEYGQSEPPRKLRQSITPD